MMEKYKFQMFRTPPVDNKINRSKERLAIFSIELQMRFSIPQYLSTLLNLYILTSPCQTNNFPYYSRKGWHSAQYSIFSFGEALSKIEVQVRYPDNCKKLQLASKLQYPTVKNKDTLG